MSDIVIGSMALRTVGNVTFLEDSNGNISVDVRKLARRNPEQGKEIAQQIADAMNGLGRPAVIINRQF